MGTTNRLVPKAQTHCVLCRRHRPPLSLLLSLSPSPTTICSSPFPHKRSSKICCCSSPSLISSSLKDMRFFFTNGDFFFHQSSDYIDANLKSANEAGEDERFTIDDNGHGH
ncbi:hypothetical protein QVD17_36555 [Tagetes erecta]|uniref:Uncharacterized protein n=1 Tax=Tagetes erecta TaxID=13708 RepID=A0AAD8JUH7_TARER|nr:hypothetical protein QVD17_36555 [Tagetes erecta]